MKVRVLLAVPNKVGNGCRSGCKSVKGHHGPRGHLFNRLHTTIWDSFLSQQGNSSSICTKTGCDVEDRNGMQRGTKKVNLEMIPSLEVSGGNIGNNSRESQLLTCPGTP